MALTDLIIVLLTTLLIFIISALPLYWAVKVLGGKTTILKTVFIQLLAGLVTAAIQYYLTIWGGVAAFLVLLWIYHEAFRLRWWKAFLAWVLQLVFVVILLAIAMATGVVALGLASVF